MKKIFIVILHYGKIETTKECIDSLKNEKYPYELIVVNNTAQKLSNKDFIKKCIVINNYENRGFAGGVNVGIQKALGQKADAILLLNNDTLIIREFLGILVETLYSDTNIGIVGPAIKFWKKRKMLFDVGGYINWFGRTNHNEITTLKNILSHEVTYLTGAAILIKKTVFQKVGSFDENYFLYYEDVDFCLRAKKTGFKIVINPQVFVSHALSKSVGKMSSTAIYHQTKSALIFGKSHYTNPFKLLANRMFVFLQTILFLTKNIQGGFLGVKALKDYYQQQKYISQVLFFLILLALSFGEFYKILLFDFWVDDWYLLWGSLFHLPSTYWYYNHPGLPIEFFIVGRFFGTHVVLWQVFGITLKAVVAYLVGIFIYQLTRSKLAFFLSSVFFAVSYVGLETLYSPIMNVAALASIPLLLSGIFFIRYLRGKKNNVKLSIIFFLIAFVFDPARVLPSLLLIPFISILIRGERRQFTINKDLLIKLVSIGITGILIFSLWFLMFESSSQIAIAMKGLFTHPAITLSKINRIGNFFAAIGNLFIGLVTPMTQNEQNTGVYSRYYGIVGLVLFFLGFVSWAVYIQKKTKVWGVIGFFILWTYLFYFPNWLSEPRAPMAGPHRYLFISSIGFCCLIAYLVSKSKKNLFIVFCSLLFILLNIWRTNSILAWQETYRSYNIVENIWQTVNNDVPKGEIHDIFMFYGYQPWLHQIVDLSGSAPFMLRRNLQRTSEFPLVTRDTDKVLIYLCSSPTKLSLSHIYAWTIGKNGEITNVSNQERNTLANLAQGKNCTPEP